MRNIKKFTTTLIFISFLNFGFSQNFKSGRVIYNLAKIKERNPQIKDAKDVKIEEMLEEESKKQEFILEFSIKKSSFSMVKKIENNDKESLEYFIQEIARYKYSSHYNFFLDNESKNCISEYADGTLVKGTKDSINWTITSEEKIIGNYKCYKAIYNKKFIGRDNKEKTRIIEAWFCPTIYFSYGPKDYYGLPGLILELTERGNTLYAEKIELSEKDKDIIFPKGKLITMEEYNKSASFGN